MITILMQNIIAVSQNESLENSTELSHFKTSLLRHKMQSS